MFLTNDYLKLMIELYVTVVKKKVPVGLYLKAKLKNCYFMKSSYN